MTELELHDQVAVVSGGSGGIGRAIAAELGGLGARVIVLDNARPTDPKTTWIETDVRSDDSVRSAVEGIARERERIDVLVHAAGVTRDAVHWKLAVDDWDLVHAVNLRGAFLLMRHVVPTMRRSGGGSIVLIGSINGSRGKFGLTAYASSKAGLIGLAKSAAQETARFGIRVNVIEPGMIRSPMTDALPEAIVQSAAKEILLGRLGEPEDVAHAVAFLCGAGARHITGQVLRVDGGQYL